jgi:hypothetical protein
MRANYLTYSLLLSCCAIARVEAQAHPLTNPYAGRAAKPAAAAVAAPAAAPTDAAPAAPSDAAAAPATAASVAATAEVAAPSATPAPDHETEARYLALERQRLQLLLARERARSRRTAPGPAPAEREPKAKQRWGDAGAAIAIGASFDTPWYTKPSYDAFSDKDVANRFGVWLAHDVAALRTDAIVALELGWGTEHEQDGGLRAGTLSTELTTNAFHAGAQLRWAAVSFLQPHARLAAGAALVRMKLDTSDSSGHFKNSGVSPFGSLGLGFTLRTPSRLFEDLRGQLASLSLGLMLEGGYTLAAPIDFKLGGPATGKRDVPIAEPKLGRLERSGPYARASFVVRF